MESMAIGKASHIDKNTIYKKQIFKIFNSKFLSFFFAYQTKSWAYCAINFALGHQVK